MTTIDKPSGMQIKLHSQFARVVDRVACEMQDRTTRKDVCLKTNIIFRLILF